MKRSVPSLPGTCFPYDTFPHKAKEMVVSVNYHLRSWQKKQKPDLIKLRANVHTAFSYNVDNTLTCYDSEMYMNKEEKQTVIIAANQTDDTDDTAGK